MERIPWRFIAPLLVLAAAANGQNAPPEWTLERAVGAALERRPELAAGEAAVTARRGALLQASLRPNPTLSLQTENWRFYGQPSFVPFRDLDLFAFVSQTIETGGKRRWRMATAEVAEEAAAIEQAAVAWSVEQAVKRAWWRAQAAERRLELVEQSRSALADFERFHQARFDLGALAEVDYIRVRVESEKAAAAVARAVLDVEQARAELFREIGYVQPPAGSRLAVSSPPEAGPVGRDWAELAVAERVEARLARALVEQARAAAAAARAGATPNVTPYFGYKRASGFNTLVGGVTIPLPLRDRNQGSIAEAEAEVRRREAQLRAVEIRVGAEAEAAAAALERRASLARSLAGGVVSRAGETYHIARAAYQEDAADLLFVLDAQRAQNEVRLLYAEALYDLAVSWVDLETAVGRELAGDRLASAQGAVR